MVGLSPSPCPTRVKALEREGFISGHVTLLDPGAVGLGVRLWRPGSKVCGWWRSGSASPSVAAPPAIGSSGHRIKVENGRWADLIRTDSGTVPTSVSKSSRLRVGKGRTVEKVGRLRCVCKVLRDRNGCLHSPSLGYNGRTTRVLGPLRVKGDPATGLMEVGVMVKTYSLLVARLVA